MLAIRELEQDDRGRTNRACSACGKSAAVQIVGQTIIRDNPSSESVDLCASCAGKVTDALIALRRSTVVAKARKR